MRAKKAERKAYAYRMVAVYANVQAAYTDNMCPTCGGGVHLNHALFGWVQCDGFGMSAERTGAKSCNWQGFLDPKREVGS